MLRPLNYCLSFIVYGRGVEDVDVSFYQPSHLKAGLLKMFPFFHIHTPSFVSKSQIMYSEDLTVGEVADKYCRKFSSFHFSGWI